MNKTVLNFLTKEHVCVLSVLLPDGAPHSATVHFSHQDDPLELYFLTWDESVKATALKEGHDGRGTVVIGFSEKEMLTLQMRGTVEIVTNPDECEKIFKIHYAKHPFAAKFKGPDTVVIRCQPKWWRYSDFNTHPETIIES